MVIHVKTGNHYAAVSGGSTTSTGPYDITVECVSYTKTFSENSPFHEFADLDNCVLHTATITSDNGETATMQFKPRPSGPAPSAPANLTISSFGTLGRQQATWDAVNNADGSECTYKVYKRRTGSGDPFLDVGPGNRTGTVICNGWDLPGDQYDIRVTALSDRRVESPQTSTVVATVGSPSSGLSGTSGVDIMAQGGLVLAYNDTLLFVAQVTSSRGLYYGGTLEIAADAAGAGGAIATATLVPDGANGVGLSWVATGLSPATAYTYSARFTDRSGATTGWINMSGTTGTSTPGPGPTDSPSLSVGDATPDTGNLLSWGTTGNRYLTRDGTLFTIGWAGAGIQLGGTSGSHVDNPYTRGVTYNVQVGATVNANLTPFFAQAAPEAINGNGEAWAYWLPDRDADSYEVYLDGSLVDTVSAGGSFNGLLEFDQGGTRTNRYHFTGLTNGTTYAVSVKTVYPSSFTTPESDATSVTPADCHCPTIGIAWAVNVPVA